MSDLHPFEWLERWERELPVGEMRVNGIRVWPLVRFALARALTRAGAATTETAAPRRDKSVPAGRLAAVWDLRKMVEASVRDPGHFAHIGRSRVDALFVTHTGCRQPIEGRYYDIHCDPIADLLEREGRVSLAIEAAPFPAEYRVPRHRASVYLQPQETWLDARGVLARLRKRSYGPSQLTGCEQIARELDPLGLAGAIPTEATLRWKTMRLQLMAEYFERVFERTQPKLAMCVSYFGTPGMAMNIAARRAGVTSLDIQHGVVARHEAYDAWGGVPAGGYELLPQVFWCWSEGDASVIDGWAKATGGAHRSVVGGQPWACLWSDASHPLTARMMDRVRALRAESSATHIVLVSLQWDAGLTSTMREMIRAAPPHMSFWLRAHPLMRPEDREELREWARRDVPGRCWVDDPSSLPLPLLLKACEVHCTRHSTVVQEAAAAGIASVVLDPLALEYYAPRLPAGFVEYRASASQAVAALERLAAEPRRTPSTASLGSPDVMRAALHALLR